MTELSVTETLLASYAPVIRTATMEGVTAGRILVIDGDAAQRVKVAAALTADGHEVEVTGSPASGLVLAQSSNPDVVVIVDTVPGASEAFCKAIRQAPSMRRTLVLAVSGDDAEAYRVAVFEAGVDDLVRKPFSIRELLLRVRVLLRRTDKKPMPEEVVVGGLHLDRGARRASAFGAPLDLTRRELDLLLFLADAKGGVRTRDRILAALWEGERTSARVVDTTVKRLRKKLVKSGASIGTVRGVGYRLAAGAARDRESSRHAARDVARETQ